MSIVAEPNAETVPSVVIDAVKASIESSLGGICKAKAKAMPSDPQVHSCVIGMISFVGDLNWTFSLILPEPTAPKMAVMFAGFEVPYSSQDMGDVVGELANVVAGDIVAKMEARRFKTQMSLPMVTRGHDVELMVLHGKPQATLEFTSDAGPVFCKVVTAAAANNAFRRPGT